MTTPPPPWSDEEGWWNDVEIGTTVFEASDVRDSAVLDAAGNPIRLRRVKEPIGFKLGLAAGPRLAARRP